MDKLLHRGEFAIEGEIKVVDEVPSRGLKMLGMGKEFTRGDKLIYIAAYAWTFCMDSRVLAGTWFNLSSEVSDSTWLSFWRAFILINTVVSVFIILWFTIGGTRDLKEMLRRLATATRTTKTMDSSRRKLNRDNKQEHEYGTMSDKPDSHARQHPAGSSGSRRCHIRVQSGAIKHQGRYILVTRVQSRSRRPSRHCRKHRRRAFTVHDSIVRSRDWRSLEARLPHL